jgi:hypothetical protein
MSGGETARKNYEMAQQEIQEHLQLRDNVLLVYLGAIGTIFGVALGSSVIVSQHNALIGSVESYIVSELEPFLKKIGEYAPFWNSSKSSREYSLKGIWMRTFGHFLIVLIPPIAALGFSWQFGFFSQFPENPLWWFGVFSTILSAYFILETHNWRKRLFEKLNNNVKRR